MQHCILQNYCVLTLVHVKRLMDLSSMHWLGMNVFFNSNDCVECRDRKESNEQTFSDVKTGSRRSSLKWQ